MCTHVSKCKNDICWKYSSSQGRWGWTRIIEESLCMTYLIYCQKLCKCYNVPVPITKIKKRKPNPST
jgi:hypothetical protein